LESAIRVALDSWDVEIVRLDASAPGGPEDTGSAAAALALATQSGSAALVWTAEASVCVYDVARRTTSSRILVGRPPFDEVEAAAIALTVKTLLAQSGLEETSARKDPTRSEDLGSPALLLEAHGGARVWPDGVRGSEPRAGATLSYWPAWTSRKLGAGIGFELGSGMDVRTAALAGRYQNIDVLASVQARWALSRRFLLEGSVLGVVELSGLSGTRATEPVRVDESQVNPAVGAGLALDGVVTRHLRLGLGVRMAYLLRFERYLVHGAPIFEESPLSLLFLGRVVVAL
jgi:hypothetical protein